MTDELREAVKKSRKESELNTVESQIRGLETRIRYAKSDKEKTVRFFIYAVSLSLDIYFKPLNFRMLNEFFRMW